MQCKIYTLQTDNVLTCSMTQKGDSNDDQYKVFTTLDCCLSHRGRKCLQLIVRRRSIANLQPRQHIYVSHGMLLVSRTEVNNLAKIKQNKNYIKNTSNTILLHQVQFQKNKTVFLWTCNNKAIFFCSPKNFPLQQFQKIGLLHNYVMPLYKWHMHQLVIYTDIYKLSFGSVLSMHRYTCPNNINCALVTPATPAAEVKSCTGLIHQSPGLG